MPNDEFQQSPRIKRVKGNATYNYYEAGATPPRQPFRLGRWGWLAGAAAVLGLGGTLVTTQLNARPVYYCASHHAVKYHTNAACFELKRCGATIKSMPLGEAKSKMQLCKECH
ncbi:Rossmann-fold NAD(P)-binding domain-containing protein [Hymenobacter baengnokdamensis]|uniref:hypothetical protein n=1 Tax=Hymenobacter baengnokdamensis TaxID=2615203 RepID=UPI001249231F|nr:hypothetical protein [Hymenobacter baengnokdamensis]